MQATAPAATLAAIAALRAALEEPGLDPEDRQHLEGRILCHLGTLPPVLSDPAPAKPAPAPAATRSPRPRARRP